MIIIFKIFEPGFWSLLDFGAVQKFLDFVDHVRKIINAENHT